MVVVVGNLVVVGVVVDRVVAGIAAVVVAWRIGPCLIVVRTEENIVRKWSSNQKRVYYILRQL